MTPPVPNNLPGPLPIPDPNVIRSDRQCLGCGYQLRGLKVGGRCPECGLEIHHYGTIDDPLSLMPLPVIKRFRLGCWLGSGCLLGQAGVMWSTIRWDLPSVVPDIGLVVMAMLWVGAVWQLTPAFEIPEAISRGFGRRGKLRLAVRLLQLAWPMAWGCHLSNQWGANSDALKWGEGAGIVIGIAGLMLLAVLMMRLAEWARDDFAEKAFNLSLWGVPFFSLLLWFQFSFMILAALLIVGWVASMIAFPVGLLSLSRSVIWTVHHADEHRSREISRQQRTARFDEDVAASMEEMDASRQDRGMNL